MDNLIFDESKILEIYRLKNLIRYNHKTRLKDENVAEHSFFVSIFSLMLCKQLKLNDNITFTCLVKALLHDMPEINLNDITHDVKDILNLHSLLKQYEDKYFNNIFPDFATLMNDNSENIINLIVKYADTMSVLQYSINEKQLGNTTFDVIEKDAIERLNKLKIKITEIMNDEKT